MFSWLQRLRDRDVYTAGGAWAQLRPIVASKGIVPSGPLPGVMNGHALNRVIPLAQSCRLSEGLLTLLSLETYDDGSILNYFVLADEVARYNKDRKAGLGKLPPSQKGFRKALRKATEDELALYIRDITGLPGSHLRFDVEDDQGTTYGCMPRGSHGDDATVRGAVGITPPVPTGATRITIKVHERSWSVIDGGLRGEVRETPEHTFVIDL